MSLTAKQDEWSNLLSIESIAQPPPSDEIFAQLTVEDRLELAATWMSDAIHARHIDYPRTSNEIRYFKLGRSSFLRALFNFAVLFQLMATFLDNTKCDHHYGQTDGKLFHENGSPTRLTLTILDMLCLVIYAYDLFLSFSVNPSRKSLMHKPWSTLRLFICLFVFMDCMIYFTDPSQPRLMRCLFPFLLISKRNNLKLMCQGLFVSAYKSLPIIKALVSILVLWGFAGFFFFRATDGNNHAFRNPGEGIAEALHCFTSRPYVLKVLDSIYSHNQASALYFVSLTLAADILCIALIVATGAKNYKQFAGKILHNRLVDRLRATTCAFYAVATTTSTTSSDTTAAGQGSRSLTSSVDTDTTSTSQAPSAQETFVDDMKLLTLSRQQWMALCAHMQGKYAPSPHTANFIFDLAINEDPRENPADFEGENISSRRFLHSVDMFLFTRCCALLAARIVVQVEAAVEGIAANAPADRNSQLELVQRLSASADGAGMAGRGSLLRGGGDLLTIYSPAATAVMEDKKSVEDAESASRKNGEVGRESEERQYDVTMLTLDAKVGATQERRSSFRVLRMSERTAGGVSEVRKSEKPSFFRPSKQRANVTYLERQFDNLADYVYYYVRPLREACIHLTGANVTVSILWTRYTVNLFYATNIALILLLMLDLCFLSQAQKVLPWFIFACILEGLFWLHISVRILAVGVRRFASFYENRADSIMNIFSLVALVKLGVLYCSSTYQYDGTLSMGWYLLIQSFRLFKLFFAVNDVRVFEHMRPVLIRASFIYFSIVYFFSIFGYSYFCNALNTTDATNTSTSNDASQWVPYNNLLNFNTLLQSLFTLFEISILGNWSIVMDAAVASTHDPASAYIFFYTYRLVITLFILPILLSFIIQVFLSAQNQREAELRAGREESGEDESRFSLGKMGIFTHNPFVPDGPVDGTGAVTAGAGAGAATRRVSASTKVSYNVNQEVLTMRRRSGRDPVTEENADTDSATLSPLSGLHSAVSAQEATGRTSLAPTGSKKAGWPLSIKLDVNKAAAKNARDKHSETMSAVNRAASSRTNVNASVDSSTESFANREGAWQDGGSTGSRSRQNSPLRGGQSPTRSQDSDQSNKVTVQYDSKAGSSMMSIWTIDDNNPVLRKPAKVGASGKAASGSAKQAAEDSAAAGREVALLRARLDATLRLLDAERSKNKALTEQDHLM